ncbi:MAG TPA: carboxymuconolactone decarboxylase family protein [Streptosporangiaceae bacterium]
MRLPPLGELSERQARISEQIASRRGGTRGPFLVWLRSPGLCERVEALGAYCRFESELPERLRELSLLIAARFWDAQYSWNAHVDKAIAHGIEPEALAAIADHKPVQFARPEDQVFYEFCTQVLRDHFVTDEVFARALAAFGEAGLVDTIGCLGNFSMLGMLLNTFQVDLQADRTPPFPDIEGYGRVDA